MNDATIEIKMKQHKPQESTPEQNSSDEDMEESPKNLNSLGIIKNISEEWWQTEAWKREEYSHTLTPTRHRKSWN
ncbi:uncharacterized protein TNCV_2021231 [Trichonephila clavipes]|nr:uncharacterized protein TNCV_2021231 [Trichonephila clavipes]